MARDEINAFLGAGTTYEGRLHFQGSVRIDGAFLGEITSEGSLVVGREANIQGTIQVGQLVLSGRVEGDVRASERVVLHKTAVLHGAIRSPRLVMEDGAVLEGTVTMIPGSAEAALAPADVSSAESGAGAAATPADAVVLAGALLAKPAPPRVKSGTSGLERALTAFFRPRKTLQSD